jgi:hypothetical protein
MSEKWRLREKPPKKPLDIKIEFDTREFIRRLKPEQVCDLLVGISKALEAIAVANKQAKPE